MPKSTLEMDGAKSKAEFQAVVNMAYEAPSLPGGHNVTIIIADGYSMTRWMDIDGSMIKESDVSGQMLLTETRETSQANDTCTKRTKN
jgi:hypothetical protein